MHKSLNILHTVEFYLPLKNGMSEVVRQISEQLVIRGHKVTVATGSHDSREKITIINGVNVISFNIKGSYVNGYVGDVNEYESYLLNSNFDIITNFAAQQWATDIAMPIIEKTKGMKFFVPTGFSMLNDQRYSKYYQLMQYWLSKYDANIFTSENYQDFAFSVNNKIVNNFVIPNGASKFEFDSNISFDVRDYLNIDQESNLILHVGSFTGIKGHLQALKIFLQSKADSNVHFILLGSNLNEIDSRDIFLFLFWWKYFKLSDILSFKYIYIFAQFLKFNIYKAKKRRIHFLKLNREQTVDVYKTASLFLFPSMLECSPVVIYESIASKTPFLSTPVGNVEEISNKSGSGIILPSKKDKRGYVYANIKESSKLLTQYIKDKNSLKSMSQKGYDFWKKNYTWENITKQYENLYIKFLNDNQ
jgi:glycosyltransferase involved in cell wall biosynthesis